MRDPEKSVLLKSTKSIKYIGILSLVLGVLAVAYPHGMGKISTLIISVILILGGFLRLVFAFLSTTVGGMILKYIYAILMVLAGIWIWMNPDIGLEALTLTLAIYFIIDGITGLIYSFSLMPIGGGMYFLMNGILGIVLGVLIFNAWPESSLYFIGIYLGIKLIVDGLTLTFTGSQLQKGVKEITSTN